jgi:hypothetical protein
MKMPSNLMQLRVIAFSLVIIIVPFFVYYYFFVSNQTKYFNGRNLRTLATLSTHLQESVDSQSSVFKNAAEKYVQDLAEGEADEGVKGHPVTIEQLKLQDYSDRFQKKALNPLRGEGANLQATSLTVVPEPADRSLLTAPRIEVKEESSQRWLYFDYTVPYQSTYSSSTSAGYVCTPEQPPIPPSPNSKYLNFKARVNLLQLISPFVNKRDMQENQGALYQDGFDAVLIASLDDQMTILFQESSAKLRILSLNNLTTSTGGKIDLKLLGQSANISDVTLGPADYKLFVQPVPLPLMTTRDGKQESLRWLACGLVENVHFQQQRLSVSYNVLIGFGFVTILVAISWPFLKLFFIGPKDRFRSLDGYMLGISAFLIAAMLTLIALFTYSYNATLNGLDENLEKFAGTIKSNFNSELESALVQIDELNAKLDPETIAAAKNVNARNLDKLAYRSSIMRDKLITPESPYPYLNTAYWMDPQGWQQIKWTVRSGVTNRVNLCNRAYFAKLKQGRSYNFKDSKNRDHEFWIEPVMSKTTGANTVALAKRTDNIVPNSTWVSAIDMRLLSLMQPVLPEGFGFAVIDETGKVFFHSAEKLHLGENLFEECDNNQVLRAAVVGRWKQSLTSSYFGKGHSVYVEPLDNFPWTLVVFHEKDSLRTTFSEILTLCLVLFLSYFGVLCLLLVAMYLLNRNTRDRSTWLWPDKLKRSFYVESIALNSILFLLSCLAVYVLPGLWKLCVPTLLGLFAVASSVWRFKRAEAHSEPVKPRWFDYRTAYVVNVTLLFCLASILPAYGCFKIAYLQEMKLFIKNGQLKLSDDMVAREERLRSQFRSTYRNTPKETVDALLTRRIRDEQRDIYDSFFFNTQQKSDCADPIYATARPSRMLAFFKEFVPLFDHSSIKRHALTTRAADNSRSWDDADGTTLVLHAREPQSNGPGDTERRIESHLPPLKGAIWWLLVLVVFVLTSLILYYLVRQLFLLAREEVSGDELTGYYTNSSSANLLVVLDPSFIGKSQLLRRMGINGANRIDIEQVARQKTWWQQTSLLNAKDPVVLDNFEYGVDDDHHSQQKLDLLEALLQEKRRTIALSTVEPQRLLSPNGKNGHTNGSAATLPVPLFSERWTDAVSRFLKVAPEDLGDVTSFATDLEESKRQCLEQPGLDETAKEQIKSAFKLIENECSPRAYLQKIGRTIAGQSCLDKATTAGLCKQIMTNARPYYSSLWNACTGEEKLTLTRLAQHGLLSPKDPDIDELLRKGLILRDPAIRIMNESFRQFILSARTDDDVAKCEKEAKSSSNWEVLKVPFTIGLLSVAAFLLLTQRELYNSALPFITGLAAGLPSFLKLVSMFQSGSGAKAG